MAQHPNDVRARSNRRIGKEPPSDVVQTGSLVLEKTGVHASTAGASSSSDSVATNRQPRRCRVSMKRGSFESSLSARRSSWMDDVSASSLTAVPFQTVAKRSSFDTSSPACKNELLQHVGRFGVSRISRAPDHRRPASVSNRYPPKRRHVPQGRSRGQPLPPDRSPATTVSRPATLCHNERSQAIGIMGGSAVRADKRCLVGSFKATGSSPINMGTGEER